MGCNSIVDPRSAPTTTYVQAATDSIYTTTPNVVLRPGDPLTVSVNVESLPNAPLDLYILMDLSDSMAAPLATVKSISQLIAQQVSSITTNVRIGFGAFNDKPIYPYSPQTPAGCLPGRDAPDCSDRRAGTRQYSFLHLANFTSNFSVPNVFVTTNLDLPESSFDALVQVLACEQELGWRNRSVEGPERGLQRLVLLITDNQPHLAGDGRLAGIYQPNDGKCHDYPSVGLVASLLKKYDVIPIFGIVPMINNTFLSSYQALQDLMTSVGTKAFARPISSSASDVLDVIKTVYQEVIQNIAITLPTQSDVAVSLSQINCPKDTLASALPVPCSCFCTKLGSWKTCCPGHRRCLTAESFNFSRNKSNGWCSFEATETRKHQTNDGKFLALGTLTFSVPGFGTTTISVNKACSCSCDKAGDSAPVVAVSVMQRRTAGSGRAKPVNVLLPITVTALTQHLRVVHFAVVMVCALVTVLAKECVCAAVATLESTVLINPDSAYVLTPGFSGAIKLASSWRAGTRQYSFLHLVNFTSNFTVPNVFVTTNLDLPESSFDALVQVLACEQELGWRNRSVEAPERGLQRLVLLITDNQPYLAGDGRLASIYHPNDGKCHVRPYNSSVGCLDTAPGILIYNEDSLLYDYPSVGLVASLLKKYDVIPVFGIVPITSSTLLINNTFLSSYQALQDLMTSVGTKAFAQPISSSASDVLDVIKTVYQNGDLGRPAALDIAVVSPLNPSTLAEARAMVGAVLR
eukprot:Em0004g114a